MLRCEDRGPVRWMILDRPERRNAITAAGWDELRRGFEEFRESEARVLVLTGAGGAFCSGADLGELRADLGTPAGRQASMERVGRAAQALHEVAKPTIAAIDGAAVGAGANLALGCDLAIGTTRMQFSELFVRRGLTVDFGGPWLLPRRVGLHRAKELSFTGRMVEAAEALELGLVLELVEPDELEEAAQRLAHAIADSAPGAVAAAKRNLDAAFSITLTDALAREGEDQAELFASEDFAEGVAAFTEKRSPLFKGR